MSRPSQDRFFESAEGDRFYRRNREALRARRADDDPALRLVAAHGLTPATVLELGCADGWRLALLRGRIDCDCVGVDCSREAIEAGRAAYPELELRVGTLAEVPIRRRRFELVIVYFVFHWNDRGTLLRACAETDRLLEDGGHLIVGDFLPDTPHRRSYHHAAGQGIFTYKQDYADIFTASNLYSEIERITFDADRQTEPAPHADARGACTLLRKSLAEGYPLVGGS